MGKVIKYMALKNQFVFTYRGKKVTINRFSDVKAGIPIETPDSLKIVEILKNSINDPSLLDEDTSPLLRIIDVNSCLKDSPFRVDKVHCKVYIEGDEVNEYISKKIIEALDNGRKFEHIKNFWKRLKKNPDTATQNDLFKFLEYNGHPITAEGYFIAYKAVRPDYYSKFNYNSEKPQNNILNAIGTWVLFDRSNVDNDRNRTCSYGLHCANWDYAKNSYGSRGDKLLEVLVDPADVVAIPSDYNNKKMRTCAYYVLQDALAERTDKFIDLEFDLPAKVGIEVLVNEVTVEDVIDSNTETYYKTYTNTVGRIWEFVEIKGATLCYADITDKGIKNGPKVYIKVGTKMYGTWKATSKDIVFPIQALPLDSLVKDDFAKSVDAFIAKKVDTKALDKTLAIPRPTFDGIYHSHYKNWAGQTWVYNKVANGYIFYCTYDERTNKIKVDRETKIRLGENLPISWKQTSRAHIAHRINLAIPKTPVLQTSMRSSNSPSSFVSAVDSFIADKKTPSNRDPITGQFRKRV